MTAANTKPFLQLLRTLQGLDIAEAQKKFYLSLQKLGPEERLFNLYKIKDKDGKIVQFQPNFKQMRFWNSKTNRDLILKSRQIGFTTFACIESLDKALFEPGAHCGIMADRKERVKEIFAMVRRAFRYFQEDWGQLFPIEPSFDNVNELAFSTLDSAVKVAFDFKGYTLRYLHVSEAAFIDEKRITESTESIPDTGRIVMETTPNGMSGYFFSQWKQASMGRGTYKRHFFPWFEHYPEHPINLPETILWNGEEEEIRTNYSLDDQKMLWRRWKIEDLQGDRDEFDRLYPTDEISCFLAGANQVFPQGVLRRLQKFENEPNRKVSLSINGSEITVEDDPKSTTWVWEMPKAGEIYAIGADPSEGIGKDSGGITVVRCSTGLVVCEADVQLDPDQLSNFLWKLGRWYNTASVCVEANNHGHAVLQALTKIYHNLYRRRTIDERTMMPTRKVGFQTNKDSKTTIIHNLRSALRDGDTVSRSSRFLVQATTYIREENGSYNAQSGSHDDLVMSYALAWEQKRVIGDIKDMKDKEMDGEVRFNPVTGFPV